MDVDNMDNMEDELRSTIMEISTQEGNVRTASI